MEYSNMTRSERPAGGFTLIELLIVVVVIAVLLAIAIPLYGDQVRQARRADAQRVLMDMALEQEKWRANNTTYGSLADIGDPCPGSDACDYYDFTVTNNTATTYTLTADANAGGQTEDSEQGTPCDPLTLDQNDNKTPDVCW